MNSGLPDCARRMAAEMKLPPVFLAMHTLTNAADALLADCVGLAHSHSTNMSSLSKGNKRRMRTGHAKESEAKVENNLLLAPLAFGRGKGSMC